MGAEFCKDCSMKLKHESKLVTAIFGKPPRDQPVEFEDGWRCHECAKKKRR